MIFFFLFLHENIYCASNEYPQHTYLFSGEINKLWIFLLTFLRPGQPNRVMSSAVSLPNHTFTGQA